MDFGKVDNIDEVDFSLPPDDAITKSVLKALDSKNKEELRLYIGCAKWGRPDWIGKIYQKGIKSKDFLQQYVQLYNSIELNALFYNLQPKSILERWASLGDKDFRFCPKFLNSITHLRQLKNAEKETDKFIDHMMSFGDKLGPSFIQLSDRFAPNRAQVIQDYITSLPRDFRTCLELRHPDWFIESKIAADTFNLLRELGVATIITDTAGRRDCVHMKLTAPVAFIRYVGNSMHPTDISRIDEWAVRIKGWIDHGLREIYFFIHNHDELYTPEMSKFAIERFNKICGTDLNVPKLLNQ